MKRLAVILMAIALAAVACGGSSDTTATDSAADSQTPEYESPLGDFLGYTQEADFDAEAEQARYQEQERQVQELVAACMQAEGFEYIPVDPSQYEYFESDAAEMPPEDTYGTDEYIRKYGFGVTTQRYSQSQVGPDLVGYNDSFAAVEQEGPTDPNQDYLTSLSDSERQAYDEALYGQQPSFAWEDEGREPTDAEIEEMNTAYENLPASGCYNTSYESTAQDAQGEGYDKFETEFGSILEEMYQRVEASPQLADFRAKVESCVADKGVDYLTEQDAYEYFDAKFEAAGIGYVDPLDGVDTTGWTDEQFNAAYNDANTKTLPDDVLAELAVLQDEERASATAILECGGGWNKEQEITNDIRIEMEQQFLDENADRLAEFEGTFGAN